MTRLLRAFGIGKRAAQIELGTTEIAGRLPAPSPAQDVPEASDLPDPTSNTILAGTHGGSAEARTGQQVEQAVQGDGSSDHSRSGVGHRGAAIRPTHVDWFSPSTVTEETPAIVGDGSAGAEEQPLDPPSSSTQPRPRPETLWLTSTDAAVEDPANERKSGGPIAGSPGTDLEARAEDHAESRLAEARRSEPSGPQLQEQPQQEGSEGAGRSTAASMGDGAPSASSRFSPVSG